MTHLYSRLVRHLTFPALACAVLLLTNPSSAQAEDSCEGTKVKLVVRTIHASGARGSEAQEAPSDTKISVENSLTDLKPKLVMLPFTSFRLISQKEEEISVKKKESIQLPNGQTLALRPMYMEKERVGMWLSWKDTDGSNILNTRIHFDADESVLTGTDYRDNEGRIIAIRATKTEPPKSE
jgi:hypothetical protein